MIFTISWIIFLSAFPYPQTADFISNGVNSLIEAFNASYHINETRSLIKQKTLSLLITLILSTLIFLSIILIIFGKIIVYHLVKDHIITYNAGDLILMGEWIIMISILFVGISIVFHLGPSMESDWRLFSPGSIFSTIFIIITSFIFSYYIDNFAEYNKIYGSIGTLMIILLWIYFNSIILLIGFELNVSILNAKRKSEESNRDL